MKEAAAALGIAPTKVTQAIEPAFDKVARLMLADSEKTLIEIQAAMQRVRARAARPIEKPSPAA